MNATTTLDGTGTVGRIASRAHQAVDDTASKAVPALERASAVAHQTIDKVATQADAANEFACATTGKLKTRSTEMADVCSNYVRAQPLASIAGALAVGYLAGRLLR